MSGYSNVCDISICKASTYSFYSATQPSWSGDQSEVLKDDVKAVEAGRIQFVLLRPLGEELIAPDSRIGRRMGL